MFHTFQKKSKYFLVLVVFLAGILRFYQIDNIPPSLTWDEVAWGYNAYALSIDGRDEFGKFLPYDYLVSFGDYKPPVYAYLAVIPIMLFGLTEFAVRLPSALFGTLTVLVTFFLVLELFGRRDTKQKIPQEYSTSIALISALLLAVSPWHIMLSRAAFEANVATFFIVTGIWLFFVAIQRKAVFLIPATLCFVLSIYTFNSTRIVAPLLALLLAAVFWKQLWINKKFSIISAIIGIALLLPIAGFLTSPEAKLRFAEVNIFSDVSIVETANQEIANDDNAWWSKIIHNRRVAYTREYLIHYFDHFNPHFLFISGDENPKFSTQDVGQMYLIELPFLVAGLLFLFRRREKYWWILPVWLLIGILPAAAARETPHALRIENTLPTWQILTAYGFVNSALLLKRFRPAFISAAAVGLALFVVYFLHGYYTHYAKEYPLQWQDGYKESIAYVKENQDKYERIHISKKMERGYIYTLFYLQYSPKKFREEVTIRGNDFGFVHVDSFGKYYFGADVEKIPTDGKKTLYIVGRKEVPPDVNILKRFYLQNGEEILTAYTK